MDNKRLSKNHCGLISSAALKDAVDRCINNCNYRVFIYTANLISRRNISNDICSQISELYLNEILKIIELRDDTTIMFKNGSYIRVVKANDGCRGYKSNYCLIEDGISDGIITDVIFPAIMPYRK